MGSNRTHKDPEHIVWPLVIVLYSHYISIILVELVFFVLLIFFIAIIVIIIITITYIYIYVYFRFECRPRPGPKTKMHGSYRSGFRC